MSIFTTNKHLWLSKKRALPAIGLTGLLITMLIIKLQPAMKHDSQVKSATPVNVIKVSQHQVRPTIIGYGTVKPDLNLQAMAEVTGRVTYVHPELKKGAFINKGTLLVSIDDKDYRLALKQAHADLLAANASLKEMELTIKNNGLELKLANQKLGVVEAELGRLSQLRKGGTISQSRLDQETQAMLVQQQEVQKLENQRTTLPSELEVLKTKIDIAQAKVEQSERDLDRTQIVQPFKGRVSGVYVEKDQFISKGNNIFDVVGMNKITINAQFPIDQFSRFSAELDRKKLNFEALDQLPVMSEVLTELGLSATVEIAGESFKTWQAKVERLSDNLDIQSRTVGVVVSVEGSYLKLEPGVRPPLLEGMYMKVALHGKPDNFLVLPRFAMHNQEVFTVSKDNTLSRVLLNNVSLQDNLALIHQSDNSAIQVGDSVVISDIFPAINGMPLTPVVDEQTSQQLEQWLEHTK